jgi:tetratricopeptide (TPR) repeat protein
MILRYVSFSGCLLKRRVRKRSKFVGVPLLQTVVHLFQSLKLRYNRFNLGIRIDSLSAFPVLERRIYRVLVFILLCTLASATYAQNLKAAQNYFNLGEYYFGLNRFEEAERCLNRSLELSENYSESWYLLFQIYKKQQETTLKALSFLERALSNDSWLKTEPAVARGEKAELLLRIQKVMEAKELLLQVIEERPRDPRAYFLLVESYRKLGNQKEALQTVRFALDRFPEDAALHLLHAQLLYGMGDERLARIIFERVVQQKPSSLEALVTQALLEKSDEIRKDVLKKYFEMGGTDPRAAVMSLEVDRELLPNTFDRFFDWEGNKYVDLLQRIFYAIQENEELKRRYFERVQGYSGERIIDRDWDGFYEVKYVYRKGEIETVYLDSNQDGSPELVVDLLKKQPVSFATQNNGKIEFIYKPYPYVYEIVHIQDDLVKTYRLRPFELYRPILVQDQGSPESVQELAFYSIDEISENEIRSFATTIDESSRYTGNTIRMWEISHNRVIFLKEDRNRDGHIDYWLRYSDGLPVEGWIDLDENGTPDARETWQNGQVIETAYDTDEDRVFDFFRRFEGNGEALEWDYDSDGSRDHRLYQTRNGISSEQFSVFWQ